MVLAGQALAPITERAGTDVIAAETAGAASTIKLLIHDNHLLSGNSPHSASGALGHFRPRAPVHESRYTGTVAPKSTFGSIHLRCSTPP